MEGKRGLYLHCYGCDAFLTKKNFLNHLGRGVNKGASAGITHRNNVFNANKKAQAVQKTMGQVKQMMKDKEDKGVGTSLSNEIVSHRISVLRQTIIACISLRQLKTMIPVFASFSKPGLSLGNPKELLRAYTPDILRMEYDRTQDVVSQSYPEFSSISDGAPKGDKFEAVVLTFILKDSGKPVNMLVRVSVHSKALSGDDLADNFIKCIKKLGLKFENWVFSMFDRAASNKRMIKVVTNEDPRSSGVAKPTETHCHSHGLVKPREKMKALHVTACQQKFNQGIMHRGQASSLCKEVFGSTPMKASGVRWCVKWEQVVELLGFDPHIIDEKIVGPCTENQWSLNSFESTRNDVGTDVKLPTVCVEAAALCDGGRAFCQGMCTLEGDDLLIFTAHLVHERIRCRTDCIREGQGLPTVQRWCKTAALMIAELKGPYEKMWKKP